MSARVIELPPEGGAIHWRSVGVVEPPLPLFPNPGEPAPFPMEALGDYLGPAADAIARKIQVPAAISAQAVLATASLAAQAHRDVLLPYGQTRPLSLFFVSIAGSGDRKSTADGEALWPIRTREKRLREEHAEALAAFEPKAKAHAAQVRKVEGDKSLELAAREAELIALGAPPPPPLLPILTAPDPTIEGLAKAWINAPASLGIFSAEGGQFIGGHGMGPDHRLKTAAALSQLWDGQGMRRMRAGDGLTILEGRRLALHLMAQPEAAATFLSDPVLRDQGLLSRTLIVAPATLSGTRAYREVIPADDAAIRTYGARLLRLLERPWPLAEGARNELTPPALTMTGAAERLWVAYFDHVELLSGPDGELFNVRDVAAKSAEQAARLAGVLVTIRSDHATEIDESAMRDGIALADFYIGEAARLGAACRVAPALMRAQRLLDWMRVRGGPITLAAILQNGPRATRTKAEAHDALAILEAHRQVEKHPSRQEWTARPEA